MKDILLENSESQRTFSRRAFGKSSAGVLVGFTLGSIGTVMASREFAKKFSSPYVDINQYREGYPWVDGAREQELLSSLSSRELSVNSLFHNENLIQGIVQEGTNYLIFEGQYDPAISLNVFEMDIAGRRFVVPLIQSGGFSQGSLYIGDSIRDQLFMAKSIGLSMPDMSDLSSVNIKGYSISADPFARELVRNSPLFYLREENQDDSHVTNDIPLSDTFRLGESFHGEWLQDISLNLSGEDGGSSPHPLAEREGRLRDSDSLAFYKVRSQGEIFEDAYSKEGHLVSRRLYDSPSTLPAGVRNSFQINTDNNMVTVLSNVPDNRCVSLVPDVVQRYLYHLSQDMINERDFATEIISIRENIRQGHIERDDDYINWFIRVKLKNDGSLIDDFI